MARLRVAPIVEGDGEFECIRILLERIWYELFACEYIDVVRPLRKPRGILVKQEELCKVVQTALAELEKRSTSLDPTLVLILLDADEDCPADLGPKLRSWAQDVDSGKDVACVVANAEYETWFVAAAESLVRSGNLRLKVGESIPANPEDLRLKKKWIEDRFVGEKSYSPTRDQPGMTRKMDLTQCRSVSPSFDKLCRELEKRRDRNRRAVQVEVS